MNNYNLNKVFLELQEANCDRIYVQFAEHGEHLGALLFFRREHPPS